MTASIERLPDILTAGYYKTLTKVSKETVPSVPTVNNAIGTRTTASPAAGPPFAISGQRATQQQKQSSALPLSYPLETRLVALRT